MEITQRLSRVRRRLVQACLDAGRAPESVQLVAVSKGHSALAIEQAVAAGLLEFGESYLQEALPKLEKIPREGLTWHFIGPIQSNKTRGIAENFDWAHAVDRLKIAQRLSEQRPVWLPPLNVCVQVNVSGESSKSGCAPEETLELCKAVVQLPRLRLRGLMAIPAAASADADRRIPFRRLRELSDDVRTQGIPLDTLSAGMSDDLEAAVTEGSTLLRIGTALFGNRIP